MYEHNNVDKKMCDERRRSCSLVLLLSPIWSPKCHKPVCGANPPSSLMLSSLFVKEDRSAKLCLFRFFPSLTCVTTILSNLNTINCVSYFNRALVYILRFFLNSFFWYKLVLLLLTIVI